MVRNIFLISTVACLVAACSIEEKTSFNADFSGTTTTKVDMTAMITFMSSMDSTGEGKAKMYRDIQQGMDSAKYNKENDMNLEMKFDTVTNAISVSYTFKSLDDANNLLSKIREKNQSGSSGSSSIYRWEKKGKVLVMPGMEDLSKLTGQGGGSSNPMLSGMTYTMIRSFPRKIVKVSDSRITLSDGGKTMTFKSTADQLINNPLKEITVTFAK